MLTFRSELFRPFLPDDAQVNPNVLGFELAEWLSRKLAAAGTMTSYPASEDWGWYLEWSSGQSAYLINCSGALEEEGHEWRIFVDLPRRWFRRQPETGEQDALLQKIQLVLQEAGIAVSTEEE